MKVALTCSACGSVFERYPSQVGTCCSRKCQQVLAVRGRRAWADRTRADRFWAQVSKTDGCWVWNGGLNNSGYGTLTFNGQTELAHRAAWLLTSSEPITDCVLHHCDNRRCVRPEHLFLGSRADNNADKMQKGRHRSLHGEQNRNSKLTQSQIDDIRRLRGTYLQRELAMIFGTSQVNISNILRGKTWKRQH